MQFPAFRDFPAPLPSLFGRITAGRHDHVHLAARLKEIEELATTLDAGSSSLPHALDPVRLLDGLKSWLSTHFDAEEAGNYFGTIARERPETLPAIVALKSDHAAFLAELTDLGRVASSVSRWDELSVRLRRLIRALREHEHSESVLVASFLS